MAQTTRHLGPFMLSFPTLIFLVAKYNNKK